MATKKIPTASDGRDLKANSKSLPALLNAPAFESQAKYLRRRFGFEPPIADVIAGLAFGERRA
jgi:hypothetical protein